MSVIRTVDILFLDELFEMQSGYVLDFSNRTFAAFFANELNIDKRTTPTVPTEQPKLGVSVAF